MKTTAVTTPPAYAELTSCFRRLSAISGALAVLEWDRATMMPAGGAEARAEQIASLGVLHHELLTVPVVGELLDRAEADAAGLDGWQAGNLRAMRRAWRHATVLSPELVEAKLRAVSRCEMVWRTARAESDFATLLPHLAEVVALTREAAAVKAAAFGTTAYEALLDEYEPEGSLACIDALFSDLLGFLPEFVTRALENQARKPPPALPRGPFPIDLQRQVALRLMSALGFDFRHGRLDTSDHPFTGGVPQDVRITTRYDEADFTRALMGVLHESGHAFYERGLPPAWADQPVGQARGMALHESQSLLIEMQVCRSPAFLAFAAPILREAFGGEAEAFTPDNLGRIYRRVARSLIRVDADEVTYPLHVILRYRLEKAMLAGDLAVADLPEAWGAGMAELIGITPSADRDGCLQDIHWPGGAFGYFPTYTLGALAAAQLFAGAKTRIPELLGHIAKGEFTALREWLTANVHSFGALLGTDEVLQRATGTPLGTAAFRRHLEERYLS
jgi:carboxypeptidase Taq